MRIRVATKRVYRDNKHKIFILTPTYDLTIDNGIGKVRVCESFILNPQETMIKQEFRFTNHHSNVSTLLARPLLVLLPEKDPGQEDLWDCTLARHIPISLYIMQCLWTNRVLIKSRDQEWVRVFFKNCTRNTRNIDKAIAEGFATYPITEQIRMLCRGILFKTRNWKSRNGIE